MSNLRELNTMSSGVIISYRSKKVILNSSASNISIVDSGPVVDPVRPKSTLHAQTREASQDSAASNIQID